MNMDYFIKYIKYKNKYDKLKNKLIALEFIIKLEVHM